MDKGDYLGDGLYASFDGWQFRLWTERETGVHEVFLDPETLESFLAYVKQARGER